MSQNFTIFFKCSRIIKTLHKHSLSDDDFYIRYFAANGTPKAIAVGVREILQEQLGQDMSRLQAEDNFTGSLKQFLAVDSMADVEIVCALEERFGIKISDQEAQAMASIRDIVSTVHRKVVNT